MIAVVDKAKKAVWGLGSNFESAMLDAEKEINGKPNLKVGKLEYCKISDKAPLHMDGEELFKYCEFESDSNIQMAFF